MLKGGLRGPAIVIGKPEESLLMTAVGYENRDLQMPPDKKLSDEQVADLRQWVKLGAPFPDGGKGATGAGAAQLQRGAGVPYI